MTNFHTLDDWPEGARPIYDAVFLQALAPVGKCMLGDWLAPWAFGAGGQKVSAGHLDTERLVLAESSVDYEKRQFRYRWKVRLSDPERTVGFAVAPPRVAEAVDTAEWMLPRDLSAEGRAILKSKAAFVWQLMNDELFARIEAGNAKVFARTRSPLTESISLVPADVWQHFEIENWETGVASCGATGERLFSTKIDLLETADSDLGSGARPFAPLESEVARREAAGLPPMTIAEGETFATLHGRSREWARQGRRKVAMPKLALGQKRSDWEKKRDPA